MLTPDDVTQLKEVTAQRLRDYDFRGGGVCIDGSRWLAVRVVYKQPMVYPNELCRDHLLYCFPSGASNEVITQVVHTMTSTQDLVDVFVHFSSHTFFWGKARFVGVEDEVQGHTRARLERVATEPGEAIEEAVPKEGEKHSSGSEDEARQSHKRPRPVAIQTRFLGTLWDSRVEAAAANLFFRLGFQISRAPTFYADALGTSATPYTPDIFVADIRIGATPSNLIVDTKPYNKADAKAFHRCAALARAYKLNVMLLFGEVRAPLVRHGDSGYPDAAGLRGTLFEQNGTWSADWVLMKEAGSEPPFFAQLTSDTETRHLHPHLRWAYHGAYSQLDLLSDGVP